jgi:hypothetical protein
VAENFRLSRYYSRQLDHTNCLTLMSSLDSSEQLQIDAVNRAQKVMKGIYVVILRGLKQECFNDR